MSASKRNAGEQPVRHGATQREHVLHDEAAAAQRQHLPETVGFRASTEQDDQGIGQRVDLHVNQGSLFSRLSQ